MHPELFSFFGFHIQTYGLMMAIGFILCYVASKHLSKVTGRDPNAVDTLIVLAAVGGVIGARIVHVIQNWGAEFSDGRWMNAFKVWQGGLVFYGGFLLATALILIYALLRKEGIRALGDFCVVFVPLGHAFGRLGCFFNGCCYGGVTTSWLGIRYPHHSEPWRHQVAEGALSPFMAQSLPVWPTQLMEAAGCLVLFGVLWWLYRTKRAVRGLCAGVYLVGYACLRFGIECLRDDPRGDLHFGLTFSQCISLGLFVLGVIFLVFAAKERDDGTERC